LLLSVVEALAHFIDVVEVVQDVLKRAVVGEFVQKGLDLLFGGGHYEVRIAWRHRTQVSQKFKSSETRGHPAAFGKPTLAREFLAA
jgi:hypothetical protein